MMLDKDEILLSMLCSELKLFVLIREDNTLCPATFGKSAKISNQIGCLMMEFIMKTYLKPH